MDKLDLDEAEAFFNDPKYDILSLARGLGKALIAEVRRLESMVVSLTAAAAEYEAAALPVEEPLPVDGERVDLRLAGAVFNSFSSRPEIKRHGDAVIAECRRLRQEIERLRPEAEEQEPRPVDLEAVRLIRAKTSEALSYFGVLHEGSLPEQITEIKNRVIGRMEIAILTADALLAASRPQEEGRAEPRPGGAGRAIFVPVKGRCPDCGRAFSTMIWGHWCEGCKKQFPEPAAQAPTAQSAPPPAGPTPLSRETPAMEGTMKIHNAIVCIPSKYRSVQEWEASLPAELQGVVTFHATGPDGEGYASASPPVEPPAPRPMEDAERSAFIDGFMEGWGDNANMDVGLLAIEAWSKRQAEAQAGEAP